MLVETLLSKLVIVIVDMIAKVIVKKLIQWIYHWYYGPNTTITVSPRSQDQTLLLAPDENV